MCKFKADIKTIGVNPFVFVPIEILDNLFELAGKDKGHIPIKGFINDNSYKQTLVKYSGEWRLYINTTMLKNSPKRIGETVEISIEYDSAGRAIQPPQSFVEALEANVTAIGIFDSLSPSKQLEIVRYLAKLKSESILEKNIARAINYLLGKERFVGRAKP